MSPRTTGPCRSFLKKAPMGVLFSEWADFHFHQGSLGWSFPFPPMQGGSGWDFKRPAVLLSVLEECSIAVALTEAIIYDLETPAIVPPVYHKQRERQCLVLFPCGDVVPTDYDMRREYQKMKARNFASLSWNITLELSMSLQRFLVQWNLDSQT